VAKWYFTTAIERLRQSLLREQREALSLKGELSDLRADQKGRSRLIRDREADIKRLKSAIATLQGEIHGLEDELKNG
jgi:chromosome segregation ATPase